MRPPRRLPLTRSVRAGDHGFESRKATCGARVSCPRACTPPTKHEHLCYHWQHARRPNANKRDVTLMRVNNTKLLLRFARQHPDARDALSSWVSNVRSARWRTPHDAIALHSGTRNIGRNRLVFNIKGNRYRLIARVNYETGRIVIRFIGTHAQYDRINAHEV